MKFKVGDTVRVKKDLKGDLTYGGTYFNIKMEKFCGNTYKIVGQKYSEYHLENLKYGENNYLNWAFTDEMLEPGKRTKFYK